MALTLPEFLSLGERSRKRILEWRGTRIIGPLENENRRHSLFSLYEFLVETIETCSNGKTEVVPLSGNGGLSKFLKHINLDMDKQTIRVEDDPPDDSPSNAPP